MSLNNKTIGSKIQTICISCGYNSFKHTWEAIFLAMPALFAKLTGLLISE